MTVFVLEQFVHTELLFYKGTQNQGKSGLDKNQVSDKIIQDKTIHTGSIQVSIQVSIYKERQYIQVSLFFHLSS